MSLHLSRRRLLAGTAATLAAPAFAQNASSWEAAADGMSDRLHSLIVRQGGQEQVARHWGGPGPDRIANIKSVSKTIVALLTGIAIDREVIAGPQAAVLPLLGRASTDGALDRLTIGHLLSMQTGLQSVSGEGYGAWVSSRNWVETVLSADMVDEPGGRFIYSTGGWHVLGAVLARQADDDLLTLARDWLGAPLDVDFAPWVRDPQGCYLGGNDMGMSPRGLSKIGQMALDGGTWQGRQVLPEDWIARSWEPRGLSPFSGDRYGYGWFLSTLGGADAAYGRGYGGQMLAVVPDREMVIAITSNPTLSARSHGYFGALCDLADRIAHDLA